MRRRLHGTVNGRGCPGLLPLLLALLAGIGLAAAVARADVPEAAPAAAGDATAMNSAGWLASVTMRLEGEVTADAGMLPSTPAALAHAWRSFDRDGSALGVLRDLGWVAAAAIVAALAAWAVVHGLGRRPRRAMRGRVPSLTGLLLLLVCDVVGLAVFAGVLVHSRHWLMTAGASVGLVLLALHVLIRWRIAVVVVGVVLRPDEPAARLSDVADGEARRLARFLSAAMLAIVALVGFGRYGLADAHGGAPHVIGLVTAALVCSLVALIVWRARRAAEGLIRGARRDGILAAMRASLARAWLAVGLAAAVGLMVFFAFGLSLGLLAYYHAATETLGLLFVLLVLERLGERAAYPEPAGDGLPGDGLVGDGLVGDGPMGGVDRLVARSFRRILGALVLAVAATMVAWTWIGALDLPTATATAALHSTIAAAATLFAADLAWELIRLTVDRQVQTAAGPRLPGADDDGAGPSSRLQTVLPLLRVVFGVVIAVLATLIVLPRLGVDTAPLIAGAGVFGLAISFGSQSLVRDVISGLFYMWDDAFRVGEYIDTGRLKGTVENLGVRSVKLRHQNGPLHTVPYGQLGAVTNYSRDFATIKFNLRLEPGTDVELVRKTTKKIGLEMQNDLEIAAEVMLPLKLQGIAEIVDSAVVLRFKFTARPVKPSWIQREYLKRIYQVFAEAGICFASGTLTLQTMPPPAIGHASDATEPAAMTQVAPTTVTELLTLQPVGAAALPR